MLGVQRVNLCTTQRTTPSEPSVYYDEGYIAAAALLEPGTRWHIWRYRSAIIPLIIRPLPCHLGLGFDVISPYDFSGPQLGAEKVSDVYTALCAWANDNDIVSGFFRFHPLIGDPTSWVHLDGFQLIHAADNVVVDLQDSAVILTQFKSCVTRDAKVAKRNGVSCKTKKADRDSLDSFVASYWKSIDRLGGDAYYRFPKTFFHQLSSALGQHVQIAVARIGDEIVASALLLLDGPNAFYYLACSTDMGRKVCAMNILLVEVAHRLHDLGVSRLHLGGGSESLRNFKGRFSPDRVPYYIANVIFDKDRYVDLSLSCDASFFPAYRGSHKHTVNAGS